MWPTRRFAKLNIRSVTPPTFMISPAINLLTGNGFLPGMENAGTALLVALVLVVSVGASYVGARRGESLYAYNQSVSRRFR